MATLQGLIGLLALTALAWGLSERRAAARWQTVAAGLGSQIAIALEIVSFLAVQKCIPVRPLAVVSLLPVTTGHTALSIVVVLLGRTERRIPQF